MFSKISNTAKSFGAAISLGAASLSPTPANAALMAVGSVDQNYKDLGANLASANKVLWLQQTTSSGAVGFGSAAPINSHFAITSAHLVSSILNSGGSFTVGTGDNFLIGGQSVSISNVLVYPGYNGTRNGPDIAILQFSSPLSGIPTISLGSVGAGDMVTAAGYGFAFRPGDAIPTSRDGYVRGWNGEVANFAPIDSSSLYYQSTRFGSNDVSLEGKILNGDSGGPVYNQFGQLVGLNTAQSGNGGAFGTSIYLNLSQPEVNSWIIANTQIPEPSVPLLLGLGLTAFSFNRKRRSEKN